MMGYSHVVSGVVAGMALLPVAPLDGAVEHIAWVLLWGGAALLPALDSPGASASRMWGPISRAMSWGVSRVAGGHRWGTHDLLLGPVAFGALAALAVLVPAAAVPVVAVALGLVLHSLRVTRLWFIGPVINFVFSWVGALWLLGGGVVDVGWWFPAAVAGGVAVAILGDSLTQERVPVPVVWMRDRSRRWGLGVFRTGSLTEWLLVAPALTVTAWWLTGRALLGV